MAHQLSLSTSSKNERAASLIAPLVVGNTWTVSMMSSRVKPSFTARTRQWDQHGPLVPKGVQHALEQVRAHFARRMDQGASRDDREGRGLTILPVGEGAAGASVAAVSKRKVPTLSTVEDLTALRTVHPSKSTHPRQRNIRRVGSLAVERRTPSVQGT